MKPSGSAPAPLENQPPSPPRRTLFSRPGAEAYHRWGVACFQRLAEYIGTLVLHSVLDADASRSWFDRLNDLGKEVCDLEWWHPEKRRKALCGKIALLWREVAIMGRNATAKRDHDDE